MWSVEGGDDNISIEAKVVPMRAVLFNEAWQNVPYTCK